MNGSNSGRHFGFGSFSGLWSNPLAVALWHRFLHFGVVSLSKPTRKRKQLGENKEQQTNGALVGPPEEKKKQKKKKKVTKQHKTGRQKDAGAEPQLHRPRPRGGPSGWRRPAPVLRRPGLGTRAASEGAERRLADFRHGERKPLGHRCPFWLFWLTT